MSCSLLSFTAGESADNLYLYLCVSHRHGAHAPGVRINPGHGEHNGSGGPLPTGAKHAGCSGTQCVAVHVGVAR